MGRGSKRKRKRNEEKKEWYIEMKREGESGREKKMKKNEKSDQVEDSRC